MMNEIRLLFGRPAIPDRKDLISEIKDLQHRYGCIVQALDADKVVSNRHILFATEKALSAFSQRRNIAKDVGMEIMRYASGERQIERALNMGVSDKTERIALVLPPGNIFLAHTECQMQKRPADTRVGKLARL